MRGDRGSNWTEQTRSELVARHGVVATSQWSAAQAGVQILRDGGTAADAAVAAAAMLAVVEPESHGLGGDTFVLYYSAEQQKLFGLNASGWAPSAWTPDYFARLGHDARTGMPTAGVNTVTVPGAVDGWHRLLGRFGQLSFRETLEPAARAAEEGFGITERIHSQWVDAVDRVRADPDASAAYLVDGRAPELYSIFRNPDMATALRTLQRRGRDAFYRGEIAEAMVDKIRRGGGRMSAADLAEFESEWVDPISVHYRGYEIHQMTPNTQGFATLEMLAILQACGSEHGFDPAALGSRSPDFWHFLIEAKKLAYSDLHAYTGDPRFVDVPLDRLLSKEHARELARRIDPHRAAEPVVRATPDGGTIYLAADRWGNMVSFISSVYEHFGSGIGVPDYGFTLQNRGALFSLDGDHPNVVAPRKRPFHTIIPAFVTRDGAPVLAFGNMGGAMQPQGQVQELVNLFDLGMNVQAAGDAARFRHDQDENTVKLESNLADVVGGGLTDKGHHVESSSGEPMGGYQAVLFEPHPDEASSPRLGIADEQPVAGVYRAGSDHRKDGGAAGW
ncbi:gamma-glutamyltransferase [Salinifilum aidingensis]